MMPLTWKSAIPTVRGRQAPVKRGNRQGVYKEQGQRGMRLASDAVAELDSVAVLLSVAVALGVSVALAVDDIVRLAVGDPVDVADSDRVVEGDGVPVLDTSGVHVAETLAPVDGVPAAEAMGQ